MALPGFYMKYRSDLPELTPQQQQKSATLQHHFFLLLLHMFTYPIDLFEKLFTLFLLLQKSTQKFNLKMRKLHLLLFLFVLVLSCPRFVHFDQQTLALKKDCLIETFNPVSHIYLIFKHFLDKGFRAKNVKYHPEYFCYCH